MSIRRKKKILKSEDKVKVIGNISEHNFNIWEEVSFVGIADKEEAEKCMKL